MRHGNFDSNTEGTANWRIISHLWPYLAESKSRVLLALACLILAKGALLTIPFLLKHLVDMMDGQTMAQTGATLVLGLVLAYGAARFSNVFFGELRDTIFGRVTERAMHRIGLKVFRHVHALDLDFHLNRRTGGLARDIERGTTGISFLMRFFVFNIAPTIFEIAMVVGILLWGYGPSFAVITLASIIAYGVFSLRATEWRTRFVREMNEADSASNTRAIDSLMNFETVKYFTNENFEADRYDVELTRWELARRKNRLSLFGLNGGQALIIAVAQTSMIGLAAFQVRAGEITAGDFILINQFMLQLFMPLGFLGFVFREIKGSLANIENLFDLLAEKPLITEQPDAKPLQVKRGGILFSKVNFSYREDRSILHEVDLAIEPGQKVAVVGTSGAGKSTLVKLLFRFYDPAGGRVLIDGQDISGVSLSSLREAIGVVPQDTVLFNDSIFENIRYGNPDSSDAEVMEAIELAHLGEFIRQLPQGHATVVGERGLKLSGGEKQRVSIARTILKRPPIMVFDEATSSLDSKSEQAILAALSEISRDHTSLVIAHRLSTIVDADKIAVLNLGRIVEQGTHLELLEKDGVYAGLWAAQQQQRQQ
ncbi:ABC transporter ATP-binding protein/permease [Halieaceae bacterium IMCC14734]|uniref:ABC transporter ATP-binding protein/permease n=1 Tax=Candidatus Litorirhabdus singularis TaxID=2518993 RepID=A0ABT3TD83_9GAMM|nr:ABC transporter ATP-binding protein/permease [Candidatus Litorirhabdus singularis]MCX2980260.1 ABC transporter ATP-binding protein/permease [Candidatus Litorirhabdus singularis]